MDSWLPPSLLISCRWWSAERGGRRRRRRRIGLSHSGPPAADYPAMAAAALPPHEQHARLTEQRSHIRKAQLLATRSDQHVEQAAQYNQRLARKVTKVRRQITAVDDEYTALLSHPPTGVAAADAAAPLEEQPQVVQAPDELDTWVQEASGRMSAAQERLRQEAKRQPVHYPRVADPAKIRPTHSSRAQRSLGLGKRSANRSYLDKLSSNEIRAMSEKDLFDKLRDDSERAKAAEQLASRPRWREATRARVMDDSASRSPERRGDPVPISAEGGQSPPAAQMKRQLQHDIEFTKGLRRRPGAKQPGTRYVPRSYTGTSGAGLWAVEQYTLRPEQWWSPPDAIAEKLASGAAGFGSPTASSAKPDDGEDGDSIRAAQPKIGRDKTAEKEEWVAKFEQVAAKFALFAQQSSEAAAAAAAAAAAVKAKEAAAETELILEEIKLLRGRADEAGEDGDVDTAMGILDQAKALEVELAAVQRTREEEEEQEDAARQSAGTAESVGGGGGVGATTVEEEISMIPGTCGQIEAVEGLLDFAQELGILRELRGKETMPFLRCHLYIKCIILPRQARDRHSET
eukprot:COSAG06_NODE_1312_length_9891_cov_69.100082_4_plen_573_part_00